MNELNLETGEYYLINKTKKILYYEDGKWFKPVKDVRGYLGTYVAHLEKQPTNIKSVELYKFK